MNCNRAEDHFSERYDQSLTPDAAREFDQHLATCANCREGYASFAAAVGSLRSSEVAATAPGYAAQVSAAVFAPSSAVAPRPWQRPWLLILSHAAALLLGWGLFQFAGSAKTAGATPDPLARVDPPAPIYIEVPVEKRVEVPVEVRVEVPVEVVKEVPVERIQFVDRPVPNPLQLKLDRTQALVADVAAAVHEALYIARLADQRAAREAAMQVEPEAPAVEQLARAQQPASAPRSPMVVLRDDDHVRIRTFGDASDVVPALIAALDDPDLGVVAAAEQHLSSIRSSLTQEQGENPDSPPPALAAAATQSGGISAWWRDVSGAAREEPAAPTTPRERWQEWWNGRSLARAETGAP